MKILSIGQVREADEYTIKNEPVASIDLMERAAMGCYAWLREKLGKDQKTVVFCGPGNNGGDGLAVARLLGKKGYGVEVVVVHFTENFSKDFQVNLDRLRKVKNVQTTIAREGDRLPELKPDDVVVDAMFGSGLSRPAEGFPARMIRHINNSESVVVSIDIPSGLYADKPVDLKGAAIVRADFTLTFQLPKLAFLFPENGQFVGEWIIIPIGLHQGFLDGVSSKYFYVDREVASSLLHSRAKFDHKGHYGHALLIAGGFGRMGAAILAARACLHTGVGLLHVHSPVKGITALQTAIPEAMISIEGKGDDFTTVPDLGPYNAVAIGPAIGFSQETKTALKVLIQNSGMPLIFDADAITILGENKTWISFVPRLSIFTPHPREFSRLVGSWRNDFERLDKQREFSVRHTSYVVLKGAHTSVSCPDGSVYFNSTGNPGMASGGSGDVLTGMILSLVAQQYSSRDACILGVYLHGLAGDLAAAKHSQESVTASLITDHIGKAIKRTG